MNKRLSSAGPLISRDANLLPEATCLGTKVFPSPRSSLNQERCPSPKVCFLPPAGSAAVWHPPGRGPALGRGLLAVSPRSVLPWQTAQWSKSMVTDTPFAQRLKHPSRSLTCKETRVSCGFTQTTFSCNPDLPNIGRAQRADTHVHSGIGFAHRTRSSGPHATRAGPMAAAWTKLAMGLRALSKHDDQKQSLAPGPDWAHSASMRSKS